MLFPDQFAFSILHDLERPDSQSAIDVLENQFVAQFHRGRIGHGIKEQRLGRTVPGCSIPFCIGATLNCFYCFITRVARSTGI